MDLGACLIAPYWGAWSEQMEIFRRGRFTLAKIYTPEGHWFNPAHARDLINAGATTIILCGEGCDPTRERTRADFVDRGWYEFVRSNPDTAFWIEVGNEVNKCELPIHMRRYRPMVLETISLKSEFPAPNLRWLVSLPTKRDQVRALLTGGDIERAYDGIATHAYGFERIEDGGADDWLSILSLILKQSRLPIYLTEVGIHAPALPKREKAERIMDWLRRLDESRVLGATIFAIGQGTAWPEYEITTEMAGQFATWLSDPDPQPEPLPDPSEEEQPMSRDPNAQWLPSPNYARGRGGRNPDLIIIHTTEGVYAGALGWLRNPASQVSAHYLLDANGGRLAQMVDEDDTAWTAGNAEYNARGVNIETEGYASRGGFSDGLYAGLGALVRRIADRKDIPIDRAHVIGHGDVPPPNDHTDPGPHFDFDRLIAIARGETNAVPEGNVIIPGNPYSSDDAPIAVGGGFKTRWFALGDLALPTLGWPVANEESATVNGFQRTIQRFERCVLAWYPEGTPDGVPPEHPFHIRALTRDEVAQLGD